MFEESKFLRDIWESINKDYFDEKLNKIYSIGWHDFYEEDEKDEDKVSEPWGMYNKRVNSISLSKKFIKIESIVKELDLIGKNPALSRQQKEQEAEKLLPYTDLAYLLIVHEMVHQASVQFDGNACGHGEIFVKHAKAFSDRNRDFPVPTTKNASSWPNDILILISKLDFNV